MTEQKIKKGGIAKKLRKGILSPCIKSPKMKCQKPTDKHDLDNIDHGTLSFDSTKYLKKNSDLDTINTNFDSFSRHSSSRIESPLSATESDNESYLKRKPNTPQATSPLRPTNDKEPITETNDNESSDSEDDVPLSQLSKIRPTLTPVLPPKDNKITLSPGPTSAPIMASNPAIEVLKTNRQESVDSKDSFYTANNSTKLNRNEDIILEEKVKIPSIPMPVANGSVKESITIPSKMEPTKTEMAFHVDANALKQSIPMPKPTDSLKVEESEKTDTTLTGNETTYIIEEIVTEEIINGKKRITTETITRRANPKTSRVSMQTQQKPSLKMPEAVGSQQEKIDIPVKMTPTKTETSPTTEGIVEMPMNFPKPVTTGKTIAEIPNLVDTDMPLSAIVDENEVRPSAVDMPKIPIISQVQEQKITLTNHAVTSSPKMIGEESTIPPHLDLSVKSSNHHPLPPIPVEAGFRVPVDSTTTQSVEAGFNLPGSGETHYMSIPPESIDPTTQAAGFNLTITNEENKAIPMPMPLPVPHQNGADPMVYNSSSPVPDLLATASAQRKQAKQQGFLNLPQPLPPSAIDENNQVMEDDKSDVSHGSKKVIVSSPKIFTSDEEIKFSEQLTHEQELALGEAQKDEKPLSGMSMPKTPSTYFKNNQLSDNEGTTTTEAVLVETPMSLPMPVVQTDHISSPTTKMQLKVVNASSDSSSQSESSSSDSNSDSNSDSDSDSDSDSSETSESESLSDSDSSSDNENLFSIKQQYEQKKKELESRIGNLTTEIIEESPSLNIDPPTRILGETILEVTEDEIPVDSKEKIIKETSEVAPTEKNEKNSEKKSKNETNEEEGPKKETHEEESSEESFEDAVEEVKKTTDHLKEEVKETAQETKEKVKETKNEESEKIKGKMDELKKQISSSLKKHQRSMSNGMSNMKKKMGSSLEQTKEHIKETKGKLKTPKSSKEELVISTTTETTEKPTEKVKTPLVTPLSPVTATESEIVTQETITSHENDHSTSFQDTLMGSVKRNKKENAAKSIKSFFSFGKKDKNKKNKKKESLEITEETIPEFPENNLTINTKKEKRGSIKSTESSSSSKFSSLKRFVSPFNNPKRRTSNASINSHKTNTTTTTVTTVTSPVTSTAKPIVMEKTETIESTISSETPEVSAKSPITTNANETDVKHKVGVDVDKPLPIPVLKPNGNMNKVIADLQARHTNQPAKFIIPEEALLQVEKEIKERKDTDGHSSVYSSSGSSSCSSCSSGSSSSSSSSSDDEALGQIMNRKKNESVLRQTQSPEVEPANLNLTRNYTNIDDDNFVSLMMVQKMLSSKVDRSESLDSPIMIPEIPSTMVNPYSIDLESERRKSYSKPKAVVTAINPHSDSIDSPRSTILYKFEDKPRFENSNLYKNDMAARSVSSLPITKDETRSIHNNNKDDESSEEELNLESHLLETKSDQGNDNRKSAAIMDTNLKQMFDDIHNLSLDDIATRYTKPSMIQCDIGPSFLDEVMGSLSMNHH